MTVKPMDPKEIERLMSNFKPTPELDKLFGKALTEGDLLIEEMERLVSAGYVYLKGGEYGVTRPAVDYAWKHLPKESAVFKAKVDAVVAKERKQKEKQTKMDAKRHDRELAEVLVDQGLLVVKNGRYHNTPKGWAEALHWFRFELGQALEGHHVHWNYGHTELHSRCGDFEGVPVSQPWRYHDNVLVLTGEFKNIKKRLLASLTEDERELFGLPPVKLNKPTATAKAKLLEVLTRYQEGAASDAVTTAKSLKGGA